MSGGEMVTVALALHNERVRERCGGTPCHQAELARIPTYQQQALLVDSNAAQYQYVSVR
jgi:hypothetical protein